MKKHLPALVLVLLLMLSVSASAVPVSANIDVHPSVDVTDFIMYSNTNGNTIVRQVVPNSFRIQWYREYDREVEGGWKPADDPASYKYEVVHTEYNFKVEPPQVIEYGGARILMNYFVSLSVVPYAAKAWWGWLGEHIKVIISVYAYGYIDKPPDQPTAIDLPSLIGTRNIYVDFYVVVRRVSPSAGTLTLGGTFNLILSGATLRFHELYPKTVNVNKGGAVPIGSFSSEGYIGVAPKGSIYVELCLRGPEGYKLEGDVSYINRFGTYESKITLTSNPSGGCSSTTISDAVIVPGNYTGDNKFTLTFTSGAIRLNMVTDTIVSGASGRASMPFIVILPQGDSWNATIYIGVDYTAFQDDTPLYVGADGTIYLETRNGGRLSAPFACRMTPITETTTYICNASLGRLGINPSDVVKAYADVTVRVSMYGIAHSDSMTVSCAIMSPSNVQGLAATLYRAVVNGSFVVLLLLVFFYVVNHLASMIGRQIVDPYYILQSMMAVIVIAALVFAVPYFHLYLLSTLYSIPEFSDILRATPLSDPGQIVNMPPDQAVAMLMSFYDMTLNRLKLDYKLWFETEMYTHILVRLISVGIIIAALFFLALALMATFNSPAAGAALGPLVGYLSMVVSMLMTVAPLAGIVNALIAVSEFVVSVAAMVFFAVLLIGLMAAAVPTPTATRFAEDLVGGGVFYLLTIPVLAPIAYATYIYVRNSLDLYIAQVAKSLPGIRLWGPGADINLIVPIVPMMRMISYVTLASIVLLMITLTHAYLLSRTGIMTGLGEAIMKLAKR